VTISKDQDRSKGAVEQDEKDSSGNAGLQGQLGHRDQDPLLKSADTDFPEPGGSPEHTGEPEDVGESEGSDAAGIRPDWQNCALAVDRE
jgi:hypothetical protein